MTHKTLYTIGYEGSSIESFLTTLETVGIELLIDVRAVPISRKKGFSKRALSDWLGTRRIDYLHLKGLGDPKPGRIAAREGRIDDFRQIFGAHLSSPGAQDDLRLGLDAAGQRMACLLCFESDPSHCHRTIVADQMACRGGFKLVHLKTPDSLKSRIEVRYKDIHGRKSALSG